MSLSSLAQDEGNLFGVVPLGKSLALAGFDATTLQPIWAHRFAPATILGAVPVAPGAGDGVVAAVDAKFVLHAFDARTGRQRWSLPLRFGPNSPPVVWNGRVYVEEPGLLEDLAQHEHRITVLDAAIGAFEASWEIPGASFFADVFVRSGERLLAAVPNGVIAVGPEER
jgi:outer membrane protein assembly factor BamB